MKKAILLLTVIAMNLMVLRAQNLTIDPPTADLQFPASEFSDALSYIMNNSTSDITVKWIRYADVEPSGWNTTVCDDYNCYNFTTSVSPSPITIGPSESGLLKLNIYPNDVPGVANYRLHVYDMNDSTNNNATLTVTADASQTGISNVGDEVISIHPIPVKDVMYVNLDVSKRISTIEMYNIVGQKFKTVAIENGIKSVAIPVSDLKKGVYFIRVLSSGKEVSTKTFSKD